MTTDCIVSQNYDVRNFISCLAFFERLNYFFDGPGGLNGLNFFGVTLWP